MSQDRQVSHTAIGLTIFAAILLIISGVSHAIVGIAGIAKDDATVYANTLDKTYVLHMSTATWGWIQLILGIIVALAGIGLFSGQLWARTVAVIVTSVSLVANFGFIPIYPLWAFVLIAINIAIIWALTAHGRDIVAERQ